MAHCNTILSQILKIVPRHEFESLGIEHHEGRAFRTSSRWSQFVAMCIGQLSARRSLRDVVENLTAQNQRLYHLGAVKISRSNLSRINENKPYQLYEALFYRLLKRCQVRVPGHKYRFKNALYSMDASTIDLCVSLFPWAKLNKHKAGVKLHVAMNHRGNIPEFVTLTDGNTHEINEARSVNFPKGSIVAVDRGYIDYEWYKTLSDKGIYFVTRLRKNASYRILERADVDKSRGVTSDQTIQFNGKLTANRCPTPLRRVGYRDRETGKRYVFLTNNFKLSSNTIASIYKSRWEIELFFKWIKQNLKIKGFYGNSKNAVLTQIWIALCVYLMIAYLKHQSKSGRTMRQILMLLQTNLFEKWSIHDLILGRSTEKIPIDINQYSFELKLTGH